MNVCLHICVCDFDSPVWYDNHLERSKVTNVSIIIGFMHGYQNQKSNKDSLYAFIRACQCDITSVELIPGCGDLTDPQRYMFAEDTVWIATANST